MRSLVTLSVVLSILLFNITFSGTTGKIVGTVVDATGGEKLVSANVVVQGLNIGATTNIEGYFTILNVPPGTYRVQASLLGYKNSAVTNVRVDIDQTTELRIRLSEEAVQQEEVTVVAERPVVERDVSASRANITSVEVAKLPTASIVGVVGLQAGVQTNARGDLIIRGSGGGTTAGGGGSDQVVFLLNGQALRNGRDNSPYTGISLTSLENIQVNTSGWTAEYGQVRSGLVNAVTKEGSPSLYSVGVTARYRATDKKHFGPSIYDKNSYYIRPFLDPDVAWTGTGDGYAVGAWDKWTRDQYPKFEGWNSISQKTLQDNDPTNDLTPQAAQKLFLWQHRRQAEVTNSDYDVDAGFGGPLIPGFSEEFGNLRFFAAFRGSRNMYLLPLSDNAYRDQNYQLKITSDIAGGMKLSLEGLYAQATGTNDNNTGTQGIYTSPSSLAANLNQVSFIDSRIFSEAYWAPTTVRTKMFGAKFTHLLSSETFYTAQVSMYQDRYNTAPGRLRDNSRIYKFGNDYYVDEAPLGFQPYPLLGNYSSSEGIGPTPGFRMAVGMSNSRDQSIITRYTGKFDFSSQLDRYNQVGAGAEFQYIENDVNYGSVDVYLPSGRSNSVWKTQPKQASAYIQDKLEFEGMIANIGLRMDYSYAGGEWYKYDPYTKVFGGFRSLGIDTLLQKEPTQKNITFSPRLGVSFPITENSKLFFNYGHFRSLPVPEDLFLIRRFSDNGQVTRMADPNNPLPRTIQYELGYEQNLLDQFLIRLAGYYKDISDETRLVTYVDGNNNINYSVATNNTYRDIRGFELSINKNRGDWIQGFLNYTYDVRSNGYFGYAQYDKNPVTQRDYEARNLAVRVLKPVPSPYARVNIDFFTPAELGPGFTGFSLLGDWRVNLTGSWSSGTYLTWTGGVTITGVENNVQWRDVFGANLRVSKSFNIMGASVQIFADVSNLFNFRSMSTSFGFFDVTDYNAYMKSLHLPSDVAGDVVSQKLRYPNIPGSDRPGDYRSEGVEYQPIVAVGRYSELGTNTGLTQTRPFYYVADQGKYYQYVNGVFQEVESGRLQQVLDDKAYIDMPNQAAFAFLNPRNIFYGVRLSFDF